MDINQLTKDKQELETKILNLVHEFENKHELCINSIYSNQKKDDDENNLTFLVKFHLQGSVNGNTIEIF